MKHGIYTCVILMAFLALSESVYAVVPVFTIASDTIRRIIFFGKETNLYILIRKKQMLIPVIKLIIKKLMF